LHGRHPIPFRRRLAAEFAVAGTGPFRNALAVLTPADLMALSFRLSLRPLLVSFRLTSCPWTGPTAGSQSIDGHQPTVRELDCQIMSIQQ
jgi:hypothetical protein